MRWLACGGSILVVLASGCPGDDGAESADSWDPLPSPPTSGADDGATTQPDATTGGPVDDGDDTTGGEVDTTGDSSSGETPAVCGDGVAEGDEKCDGRDLGEWDCLAQGFEGGELACDEECKLDTTGCFFFICGNGTVQGAELCDGEEVGGVTCADQGFDSGQLLCNAVCDGYDTTQCGTCGNGIVDGSEICEVGDIPKAETCAANGFDSGEIGCVGCAIDTAGCGTCGNGVVDGAETCDGVDLGGESCGSLGLGGGALACSGVCQFDPTGCDIAAISEISDFPVAGDPSFTLLGGLPWNGGDWFEGTRMTMIPSLGQLDVHLEIITNGLTACGFQEADVSVNGVSLGTFTVVQGTTAIDASFPAPSIPGPVYTVRYETTATVAGGCGAAGYGLVGSTVTFHFG